MKRKRKSPFDVTSERNKEREKGLIINQQHPSVIGDDTLREMGSGGKDDCFGIIREVSFLSPCFLFLPYWIWRKQSAALPTDAITASMISTKRFAKRYRHYICSERSSCVSYTGLVFFLRN